MGWFRSTPSARDEMRPSFEDRLAQIGPGVPGHCPACDGLGYIDSIDIGYRYQIQHCKDCQHRWEYLFDGDGTVVGLTELDPDGRPLTRSRIRTDREAPAPPAEPAPVAPVAEPPAEADDPVDVAVDVAVDLDADVIVDLRDETVEQSPVLDLTGQEPTELSPAEWLRQTARR